MIKHNQTEENRLEQSWVFLQVGYMLFCQHSIHANCKNLEQSEYQSSLSYKREDAKADPFTWIRLHTHTCMHAQIQSI